MYLDDKGEWQAEGGGRYRRSAKIPLPVDISITNDDSRLWVNTWNDGMTRLYDISDPHNAKQIYEKKSATRSIW